MDQSTTPTIDRANPINGTILDALGLRRTAAGLGAPGEDPGARAHDRDPARREPRPADPRAGPGAPAPGDLRGPARRRGGRRGERPPGLIVGGRPARRQARAARLASLAGLLRPGPTATRSAREVWPWTVRHRRPASGTPPVPGSRPAMARGGRARSRALRLRRARAQPARARHRFPPARGRARQPRI